jgi:predicted adenine nucleotide alpha hydrolase (AANH) superfamily ATPase
VKVLLHICCAPCACYPLKVLKEKGFEVVGLWYNPNIHPCTEFVKRMATVKELEKIENIKVIYFENYEPEKWFREVAFREEKPVRCQICYSLRLEMAAAVAKKGKFDYFTSTLFYSKYQKRELMLPLAENASRKFGVKFLDIDFRKGWSEGIEISKSYNLYRQQYCGCLYSEKERYCPKKTVKADWVINQILKEAERVSEFFKKE